jgi:GR25 family glycosyltransferase involved in LPS biosynthesis
MNLKKYFDKIYCINLDRREDRWEESVKEFEKWGLLDQVERYSAIDGTTLENSYNINNGELGILNTHLNIIEESLLKKYGNILIIEDDIEFTDNIKLLDEYMSLIPNDWDMIYFGGNHNKHMGKKINYLNEKIIKLEETYGIHCVVINNSIYDLILNVVEKRKKPIDVYYADIQKNYNCYGFNPSIGLQRVSYSDIQNKVMDYKWLF